MADPLDPGQDEADHKGDQRRLEFLQGLGQRLALGQLGDVDLQHQQRDDDREDPVGQGKHAGGVVLALE
jgi:hypothetical protein